MATFLIDDAHLRRLSPATRRELLDLLADEIARVRDEYASHDWNPDGTQSYPLTFEEATMLVNGIPERAERALRVFAENYDGNRGTATLKQLLDATGHTKFENLGQQLAWLQLRLRTVTGNPDAWMVNWRKSDWKWSDEKQSWMRGRYFITRPAVDTLRQVFELE